jgi:homoserine kinase
MTAAQQPSLSPQHEHDFEIRVPASIANLGPGFDTLAVAVQLYMELRVRRIPGRGELRFSFVEQQPPGENLVERGYRCLAGDSVRALPSLHVEVESEIPMGAGLGSSAAAIVAGLRLYEAVTSPVPRQTMLNAACALEGHPDNAAAALLGGLTVSCQLPDGSVCASRVPWPEALGFAVLTPKVALGTKQSRAVLPESVSRTDAVFNLQRIALLLQSLQSEDTSLLKLALGDRLHQPWREDIVPGLAEVLQLEHRDLLGVCLSGSGPSIVGIAERNLWEIGDLLASVYRQSGIDYDLRLLQAHQESCEPYLSRAHLLCCS